MSNRQKILTKVFGDPQKKILRSLEKKVKEINALEDKYKSMSDDELTNQTSVLKDMLNEKK